MLIIKVIILRFKFTIHFRPKNLKCKEKTHDLIHDLLIHDLSFYWTRTTFLVPEFMVIGMCNFEKKVASISASNEP